MLVECWRERYHLNKELFKKDISECEKLIMKIIWDAQEDIATPDIIQNLHFRYGRDYARTTVVTFVQRLVSKGFVTTYRKGRVTYSHAEIDEKRYLEYLLINTMNFWFDGQMESLFASLLKCNKPSQDEIEKIRVILEIIQ